jgi:hypothetical protein
MDLSFQGPEVRGRKLDEVECRTSGLGQGCGVFAQRPFPGPVSDFRKYWWSDCDTLKRQKILFLAVMP